MSAIRQKPSRLSLESWRCASTVSCWAVVLCGVAFFALVSIGCERKNEYSQQTPDQVLRSALEMVKQGDTARLSELLYAESPQMRSFWNETGVLLGNMQKLSKAVQARFPEEFAKLKQEAAERSARGEASTLLDMVRQGGPSAAGKSGPEGDAAQRDQVRDLINRLFADPYAWLEANAERLTAEQITDDTATILLDGQPVIPIVGLPMRLEDDRWFVVLPLSTPPVGEVMPRTDEQWQILRSVVRVLNKTVIDMTDDVQQGRVTTLDALARSAQKKALFPAAIAFAAYGKELDISNRVQRRTRSFRTKLGDWSEARAKLDGLDKTDEAVSKSLRSALERLAPTEIEKLVRANKPSRFDQMSDPEFEEILDGWLRAAGLRINLNESLAPARVDPILDAWQDKPDASESRADKSK